MRRHIRQYDAIADLNLTNLLDVSFVLLLAFMMVAPSLKTGLSVDLPRVEQHVAGLDQEGKTITVEIRKQPLEGVYVDDRRLQIAASEDPDARTLERVIADKRSKYPAISVVIEADRASQYETFARVVAALQALGIDNVGLVTKPFSPNDDE